MARRTLCVLCALFVAVWLAPDALAAKKKRKPAGPKVTKISPMNPKVGDTVTIRGRGFSRKRRRNTVIFRSASGKSAFVKPVRASRKKLVVVVPRSLELAMAKDSRGKAIPTRFVIRVLARRFGKFTRRARSPLIAPLPRPAARKPAPKAGTTVGGGGGGDSSSSKAPVKAAVAPPADCDHDGTPDSSDSDDDNDLLSDSTEATIHTNRCLKDTDGDGVEDGFEYQSALDLNHYPGTVPLPYPGKRPYPNPLDPSDAVTDYDGDGLLQRDEYSAWLRFSSDGVKRIGRPANLNLTYSDGLQSTVATPAPAAPPLLVWDLDYNGDGSLSDDERDVDGDGMSNWDEAHGRMTSGWWTSEHDGQTEPMESVYPGVTFPQGDFVDNDTDGDGVLDGNDDWDHDGLSNAFELRRPANWQAVYQTTDEWAYVQPFNPCKPFRSDRCHTHPPFGYYDSDEVPPIGPAPPPGYPGSAPATP